jgi:hypothetical protein
MFIDLIARLARDGLDELFKIISLEEHGPSAFTAKQKMLMTFARSNERLTSLWLMNALDQTKFFEFLEGAIDGD